MSHLMTEIALNVRHISAKLKLSLSQIFRRPRTALSQWKWHLQLNNPCIWNARINIHELQVQRNARDNNFLCWWRNPIMLMKCLKIWSALIIVSHDTFSVYDVEIINWSNCIELFNIKPVIRMVICFLCILNLHSDMTLIHGVNY